LGYWSDILLLISSAIYNASKAALAMAGETWRLEMHPLGVRVVTVVTGTIKSNANVGRPEYKLPEGSYYKPIQDIIALKDAGKFVDNEMDTDVYAELVVKDIERGANGKVWRGPLTGLIKFGKTWFPTWLMVSHATLCRYEGREELISFFGCRTGSCSNEDQGRLNWRKR
jgi:1-acylglycerone phosphate reductase